MRLLAPSIVIIDIDAGIPLDEREAACLALTRQCLEHFAPAWGSQATVRTDTSSRPGEWRLELRKVPTIEGALGFHDRQHDGTPVLYVFPELCAQDGSAWTSCASHEILEALADPLLRRLVQAPNGDVYALEVCDAVEGDTYQVAVGTRSITLSNFTLPAYWEPQAGIAEQYDWLARVTTPYAIEGGGYNQTWTPASGWKQLGERSAYRQKLAELGLSRGARRPA